MKIYLVVTCEPCMALIMYLGTVLDLRPDFSHEDELQSFASNRILTQGNLKEDVNWGNSNGVGVIGSLLTRAISEVGKIVEPRSQRVHNSRLSGI